MKARVLTNYGSPDFFELQEVAKPRPEDNEVLIKVHASSVNSWDWEILMGKPFINRVWCKYSNEPYDIVIRKYYG